MNKRSKTELLVYSILLDPNISKVMHELYNELPDVFEHSINVANLVAKLYEAEIDVDSANDYLVNATEIIKGALLHDIGKMNIPKKILYKKTKLSAAERQCIQEHPINGYNLLLKYEQQGMVYSDIVKDIVRHHHEKLDGTGYPDGTHKMSKEAKLVAICDKYDAMTEDRPYRPAMSMYNALKILSEDDISSKLLLLLASCTADN